MKPALYYALHRHYGSYRVIAVTSETKRSWRQGWAGREADRDNMPTHGRLTDLVGKFETPDQARSVKSKITTIHEAADRKKQDHYAACRAIDTKAREEIDALIRDALLEPVG